MASLVVTLQPGIDFGVGDHPCDNHRMQNIHRHNFPYNFLGTIFINPNEKYICNCTRTARVRQLPKSLTYARNRQSIFEHVLVSRCKNIHVYMWIFNVAQEIKKETK